MTVWDQLHKVYTVDTRRWRQWTRLYIVQKVGGVDALSNNAQEVETGPNIRRPLLGVQKD